MRPPSDSPRPPSDPQDVPRSAAAPADPPMPPVFRAPGTHWRGITWQDVPGHDAHVQKLNFSLLRRGMMKGYESCKGLEGEALKAELQSLSARNQKNSKKSYKRHLPPKPAPTPEQSRPPRSARPP